MREVAILGCGMTKFGRHDDRSLVDLMVEASVRAIDDAGINKRQVDALYAASMQGFKIYNAMIIKALREETLAAL